MRTFNYIKDYMLISSSVKGYINQLEKEVGLLNILEENKIYENAQVLINNFKNKYSNLTEVYNKILNDLSSPRCVNYYYENNAYPKEASPLGEEFAQDLKSLFIIEDRLKDIALRKWETELTAFDSIVNGNDFMFVGHACSLIPGTPDCKNYNPKNLQYISCTLFTAQELNTFMNQKIVYLCNVDKNNYISSSFVDSVTADLSSPDFLTLKEIEVGGEKHYIKVGFSHNLEGAVTTISTPRLIEKLSVEREREKNGEILKYEDTHTNEIVLDRTKTRILGTVLLGNGCDLLLEEYLILKNYNIDFKVLNKGLYRENNGLTAYTEKEYNEFIFKLTNLDYFIKNAQISSNTLENYYHEVVIPMNYSSNIKDLIDQEFSKYIDINTRK